MLPKDPMILLSYVNTQLRDRYDSLEDLCEDLGTDLEKLENTLADIGFRYDSEKNRFR